MADSRPLSLFDSMRNHLDNNLRTFRASKTTLIDLSHDLEDMVLHSRAPAVIFTGFQESRYWEKEATRYHALADVTELICIFARDAKSVPDEHYITVSIADDDPLRLEWFLLVITEQFSALLCSQDLEEPTDAEATRTFNAVFTFAPDTIQQGLDLLVHAVERYQPERAHDLRQTLKRIPLASPQGNSITSLIAMMMTSAQERHDQLHNALMHQQEMQARQERLEQTLVEVAVPVIPLIPGVLVMPLVGHVDARRSQHMMETLLEGIAAHQADVAILDITGVPIVDTGVANDLIQTVKAANLLGTRVILTGIGADIAQTLVHLEVDFSSILTLATLQAGIEAALEIQGLRISKLGS